MLRRSLSIAAVLAAGLLAACADSPTGPKSECQITQGAHDCVVLVTDTTTLR